MSVIKQPIFHWNELEISPGEVPLIAEEPLSIRVQGEPYAVVMRTPGDEIAHAAGFCLSEGIADSREDITSLSFCGEDTNVVAVTLSAERRKGVSAVLDRRSFISQTSCGICGKSVIEDLQQHILPIRRRAAVRLSDVLIHLEGLGRHQPLREKTRAAHAAAIYTEDFRMLASAEDLGRHNALDKAIGKAFLNGSLSSAALAVMSSRTSYELIQKAARADIPIVVSMSRPTALAVELANRLGMSLACRAKGSGLYIFTGKERFF